MRSFDDYKTCCRLETDLFGNIQRHKNYSTKYSTSLKSKPLLFMHELGMELTHFHRPFGWPLTKGSKLLIELTEQTDISTGNNWKHGHDTDKSKQSHGTTPTSCLQEL